MRRHALLLPVLLCLPLAGQSRSKPPVGASAQGKLSVPAEIIETLTPVRIELVAPDATLKVDSTMFRAVNFSTWMVRATSSANRAPKGLTQIRLGSIDPKKLPFDLLLVKLDERKDTRFFRVEIAPNKSGAVLDRDEVKAQILFEPYQVKLLSFSKPIPTPKPEMASDQNYVINILRPLAPGHYAIVPGLFYANPRTAQMTQSPDLPGWEFDVTSQD